uniref:Red chlorophyll catabolite reductase n=1 Tax=Opuntia streptacantha TaxID=393608 RepID=A0A7C9EDI5_OPUST
MAHAVCQANLLSPLISLSSSSAVAGAASNWCYPFVSLSNLRSLSTKLCCAASPASQMEIHGDERPRFKDFPYACAPIRDLMVEALSTVESRLGTQLVPYTLPPDVEYYTNESGTNHGSLCILSGAPSSPIDFVLSSWLHCKLPTGAAMNITSLTCYMNDSTDAPPLVMEFIQGGPTSLVVILDLPPRRDLVLYSDYLKTFYEETELEKQRQLLLDTIPEAKPYVSPSLYIRCVFSPTAITARVDTSVGGGGGETRLEEIVRERVSVAAKKVLETWLEVCACGEKREVTQEEDRAYLKKRDAMFKSKTIEVDIGSSLPRLFGQEIADRVLAELRVLMGSRD